MQDEKLIDSGNFEVTVDPLSEQDYTIEGFALPDELAPGAEYWLNLHATLKEDTRWAEAGYEVAKQQFKLDVNLSLIHI